jgi:hypothetical protein
MIAYRARQWVRAPLHIAKYIKETESPIQVARNIGPMQIKNDLQFPAGYPELLRSPKAVAALGRQSIQSASRNYEPRNLDPDATAACRNVKLGERRETTDLKVLARNQFQIAAQRGVVQHAKIQQRKAFLSI